VIEANKTIDLAAARLGARRLSVEGDGRCQWYSLAHYADSSPDSLKDAVLDQLCQHRELYEPWTGPMKDYIQRMSEYDAYGDGCTLQAAALVLNAQIWVLRADEPGIIRRVAHPPKPAEKVITLTFRGADEGHYDILEVEEALRSELRNESNACYAVPEGREAHRETFSRSTDRIETGSGIIFVNVQRNLVGHLDELTEQAHAYRPAAIFCSETDVAGRTPNEDYDERNLGSADLDALNTMRIPGYQLPRFVHRRTAKSGRQDDVVLGGGLCVYVREGVPCRVRCVPELEALDECSDFMLCELWSTTKHDPIKLHFVYRPPHQRIEKFPLSKLPTDGLIIFGDFNAHTPQWSNAGQNKAGTVIADWVEETGARIHNDPDLSTRVTAQHGATSPDLLISSRSCRAEPWGLQPLPCIGADHLPLLFNVPMMSTKPPRSKKWNLAKMDRVIFAKTFIGMMEDVHVDSLSLSEHCQAFTEALWDAGITSTPYEVPSTFWKPWWTERAATAIRARRQAKVAVVTAKLAGLPPDLDSLDQATSNAKTVIAEEKVRHFSEELAGLDSRTHPSKIFEKIRALSGKGKDCSTSPLKVKDRWVTEPRRKSEAFADFYSSAVTDSDATTWAEVDELIDAAPDDEQPPFTIEELRSALSDTEWRKAAGPDGIPSDFLLALPDEALPHLLRLVNRTLEAGELPETWLLAYICPLHKHGKDATHTSSYRPIWLTSVVAKLAEKMIQLRLLFYTEVHSCSRVHGAQTGGRRERDCNEALSAHTAGLQKAMESGLSAVVIYLDMKGAFDRVPRRKLLQRLAAQKIIPKRILVWLAAFLRDRKVKVRVDENLSTTRGISTGVPQGSVLGPILYILYLSDLQCTLDATPFTSSEGPQIDVTTASDQSLSSVTHFAFVDDITITVTAPTRRTAVDVARQVIVNVDEWSVNNHAVISAEKTVAQYLGWDKAANSLAHRSLPLPSSRRLVKTECSLPDVIGWLHPCDYLSVVPTARERTRKGQRKQHAPLSELAGTRILRLNGVDVNSAEDIRGAWEPTTTQDFEVATELQWQSVVKLLGVRIDDELQFEAQARHAIAQHRSRMGILHRLAGTDWGCSWRTLRMVYLQFVQPAVTWGLSAWGPLISDALEKSIAVMQHSAARLIRNLPKTSSAPVAMVEANLLPFADLVDVACIDTYDRMYRLPHEGPLAACIRYDELFDGLTPQLEGVFHALDRKFVSKERPNWRKIGGRWVRELGLDGTVPGTSRPAAVVAGTTEVTIPRRPWLHSATAEIRPEYPGLTKRHTAEALAEAAVKRIRELREKSDTLIYTDGSAGGRHATGAYWVEKRGPLLLSERKTVHAGWFATSFQSETRAVLLALSACLKALNRAELATTCQPRCIAICTDSQSLLRRLMKGSLRQRSAQCFDIWRCIEGLQTYGWNCTLQYVPSHMGLLGNENADDLAKLAAEHFARHPPKQHYVHRGAITAHRRRTGAAVLRKETADTAWSRHTGSRRVIPPRELRRAGERVIMGLACGQHPLVIPRMSPDAPAPVPGSHHGWCPHCLTEDVPQQRLRDTAHILLFCPSTGMSPHLPDARPSGDQAKEIHKILCDSQKLLSKLVNLKDLPGPLSHYISEPPAD
jgi:ribonuclease HI